MADWGIKVSLPGKDISSTTPEDFVLNSKFGTVKIVQQPTGQVAVDVTVAGSTNLVLSIAHNLTFIPLALVYAERTPSSNRFHFGSVFQSIDDRTTPVVINGIGTYVDDTDLVISFTNDKVTSQTIKLYYYILGDSAE